MNEPTCPGCGQRAAERLPVNEHERRRASRELPLGLCEGCVLRAHDGDTCIAEQLARELLALRHGRDGKRLLVVAYWPTARGSREAKRVQEGIETYSTRCVDPSGGAHFIFTSRTVNEVRDHLWQLGAPNDKLLVLPVHGPGACVGLPSTVEGWIRARIGDTALD